jgi:electron transfer flavoprotein alpha subunit
MDVIVFSDKIAITKELINGARALSGDSGGDGSVLALVIGERSEAESLAALGCKRVYWLGPYDGRITDDFVPTIQSVVAAARPGVFLVGATVCGRAVAGRTAAALRTAVFANAKDITVTAGRARASHVIYGGNGVRTERGGDGIFIATVAAGTYEPAAAGAVGEVVEVEFIEPGYRVIKLGSTGKAKGGNDVTAADRVVGVGRGVETREDLESVRGLARELGAALGYSRPVVEAKPPLVEGEPYIGISGVQIKPELYIAVAISGQAQHITGVHESGCIVCVNKDAGAPIFSNSDYGVVGDYRVVLPEFTKQLRQQAGRG